MKIYDNIIIGAGLSGLYISYKLNNNNTLIFEKKDRIGGKIITINTNINNIKYDVGAVRISSNHRRIKKLIKELKLDNKIIYFDNKITFNSNNKNYIIDNKIKKKIIDKSLIQKKKYLQSNSGYQIITDLFDNKIADYLINTSGYNQNLEVMNYYDYLRINKNMNSFYYLEGGLSQICNSLFNNIKNKIKFNCELIDYKYINNIFIIKIKNNNGNIITYKCKKLILSIPKENLLKINSLNIIYDKLCTVSSNNFSRIYAIYPKINNKYWFSDLSKVITDSSIRQIIPTDYQKGLIQISYSDGNYAKYWENALITNKTLEMLNNQLKNIFPKKNIPNPIYLQTHYWKYATHYWLPTFDSKKIHDCIIKPFNYHLYICGESYSMYQGWMEGALETSDIVLNKINYKNKIKKKDKNKIKYYTLKEVSKHNKENDAWLIINGKVYDVTKWIPKHPGALSILKGIGKDATNLYYKTGHSKKADYYLNKLLIGELNN